MTAEDAAFSIDRAVNSDLNCNVDGYVFGDDPLEVSVRDDSTLVVGTKTPDPILPLRISFVEIVPRGTSIEGEGARADRHRPVRHRRLGVRSRSSAEAQ